ncbi:MAG TPA: hypothetical protein VKD69_04920 [Vicinamibacterales bacterium]|nr:hypothetical protein [Vicinamibacterales bacterium]
MALPWLQIIDAAIGVTDLVRSRKIRTMADDQHQQQQQQEFEAAARVPGALEARLAGVMVAALKEVFDRDSKRLEIEREEAALERERAERALRLELRRQAGDREIGRLRLLAGVAVVSWLGTLFFSARLLGGPSGSRVALGAAWTLLLAAVAASFTAQSHVAALLDSGAAEDRQISSGTAGAIAVWLIVIGLAVVGVAVLIA